MIPQLVTVQLRTGRGSRRRLWVPLLPVALLLSPVLVLAVIGLVVGCLVLRVNPLRALSVTGRLLGSLAGTHVEIEHGERLALVKIR